MSNNNFWDSSKFLQQSEKSSHQNDEWNCSTDDWNYIEHPTNNTSLSVQTMNLPLNSDLPLNSYPVSDSFNGTPQSIVNSNKTIHNVNNGIENGQHKFSVINHNWFDKSENQHEQIINVKHTCISQDVDSKENDDSIGVDENFWADVENREILPPESFQNDSLPVDMNNLQISDEVINSNVCDNNGPFNNTESTKWNSTENDHDRPPIGLHRLVTGQTKSFDDDSEVQDRYGPQPFDVRTVPGQLSDDDIPVQRHIRGPQPGVRSIDNNSNFQNIDNNSVTSKKVSSLAQFQNQFEGHSRQVLHRDVEDFVNQPNVNQKLDDSTRVSSDNDMYTSVRNESHSELREPNTVIKQNRPRILNHEVFERTGPDGYMNETSPYIRSTTQNQVKPVLDSQQDKSLKLSASTQLESIERTHEYDRINKRVEKKHPPPPPGFDRMVEGNIGEGKIKSRPSKVPPKNDERHRLHSIDSDSSLPPTNPVSDEGHKSIQRGLQPKKYSKNVESYQIRDRRYYRHPKESEEDYFYEEEEEENASLSPEIESEYRSHRSRNRQPKRYKQRVRHDNYDHSDIEYPSEFDDFDDYERRRRYRSPESDYRRHPRNYRDRRYQDDTMNGQYYRRDDFGIRIRPSSRTDSDYHRRFSSSPFPDYSGNNISYYIEMMDPLKRKRFLLKFREENPKAYAEWYASYKAKVEMQKLIIRNKNGSECSSPVSTQSHDIGSLNHMARIDKEKEIHRTTPLRYQKYHINAKLNMGFGKLFMLDSSNATINIFKAMPELDDIDTAELFRYPTPFVIGKTHKNAVAQYLNKLAEEASSNSERLLYELICMITKRNGIVDGTDISELLMENVTKYPIDEILFENIGFNDVKRMSVEPLNNFRELLLQGNKSEALEFAILNQDWGLAFILALYMDSKTLNYVRFKYFQTIPQNDTLQTFFQLSSGKIPSCTTCCTDNSWGDWRKHLAMILSNQHVNINNARNATILLGDNLNAKGDVFGAHFCYLAIQIPLESYGLSSKYTLLGTPFNQVLNTSATNRAILLTCAYEFSMRLNLNHFHIPSLLPYKYLLATRLAEYGECDSALHHLEAIATQVISSPGSVNLGFIVNVVELSTDLHYMQISNNNLPGNVEILDWLQDLKHILTSLGTNYNRTDDIPPMETVQQIDNYQSHQLSNTPIENEPSQPTVPDASLNYSTNFQAQPLQVTEVPVQKVERPHPHLPTVNPNWQPNTISQPTEPPPPPPPQNDHFQFYDPTSITMTGETASYNNQIEMTSEVSTIAQDLILSAEAEKTISTEPKFGFFDRQMAELEPKGPGTSESKPPVKRDADNKRQPKEKNSWLGGLTKFWKPSNNDTIGNNFGNEETVQQAAPPMDSELNFNPVANSSPANQSHNQFKIQKKRGVKDMYVNVMNNDKSTKNILAPDSIFQANQTSMTYYNPSQ